VLASSCGSLDVGDVPLAGRVYLISGRTRSVIYSVASPEPQSRQAFGFTVATPGDLTGDRKPDLVVGAYAHDDFRGESSPGVPNLAPCGAPEPNLNGDGRSEVIVGASSNDVPRAYGGQTVPLEDPPAGCRRDQGQAFVFDGATGESIRTYDLPAGDEATRLQHRSPRSGHRHLRLPRSDGAGIGRPQRRRRH
jgi:hypothetical protein